jgi:hypothetical protein
MTYSHNHCCHRNTTHSLCTVVDLRVAVNHVKLFSVGMGMQLWGPVAMLLSYKIFCTGVNNINVLTSSCKLPDILVLFLTKIPFFNIFIKPPPPLKFHENPSSRSRANTFGQTDRRTVLTTYAKAPKNE